MKRILAIVVMGVSLLTLLAACGPSSPETEPPNKETPTATPSETVEREFDWRR